MRVLYQLMHQGYKLRAKTPKTPAQLARLPGATEGLLKPHAGTHISLDFLYPYSAGHESSRTHHVARATPLDLLVRFAPDFLFFQNKEVSPAQSVIRVSFKTFKLRYRGAALTGLNPAVPVVVASMVD